MKLQSSRWLSAALLSCTLLIGQCAVAYADTASAEPAKDMVLQAMTDELNRSMKDLHLEKKSRPYFIQFYCGDTDTKRIEFELGHLIEFDDHAERLLEVDCHVGDPKFDNTANLSTRSTANASRYVAMDDNYNDIRRSLWVLTDDAYKAACEDLEKQEAYKRGHVVRNLCESYSLIKPIVSVGALPGSPLQIDKDWHERLRKLSLVFSKYPEIRKSWIVFEANQHVIRCTTSEGTVLRFVWTPVSIGITAYARCEDGEDVWDCNLLRVNDLKKLPSQEELEASAKGLAENLLAYTRAERKNYYYGPVLFRPQASGELVEHGIAPKLCASPGDNLQPSGTLLRSMNTRILPKFLSLVDDPELTGDGILNSTPFDDEAVPSKKVQLIEKGFLKELLSSRTPVLPGQVSNGRFRGGQVVPSTLIMQVHKPTNVKEMETKLRQMAKEQGLKEAIIVSKIVNQTPRLMNGDAKSARSDTMQRVPALEIYSVDVDSGKKKRVRGLLFRDFGLSAMQGIVAAGNDATPNYSVKFSGNICSVVAPSLLVNNLELEDDGRNTLTPYPVSNPNFEPD